MADGWLGLLEMLFFLSIPLVWGLWELRKLRREQRRDRERAQAEAAPPPDAPR